MIPWENFITDLIVLIVIFTVFVVGSLLWKPRIWLHDFTEDIQALAGPKTPDEKRLTILLAVPFFITFFGVFILFTSNLKAAMGTEFTFFSAWLYAYVLFVGVNAWDWLIIDWIGLSLIDPQKPLIPGTEGAAGYRNYAFHFHGFLKGSVMGVFLTAFIAAVVTFLI